MLAYNVSWNVKKMSVNDSEIIRLVFENKICRSFTMWSIRKKKVKNI